MRVFLTGAAGYIGSQTTRVLLQRSHEVATLLSPSSDRGLISDLVGKVRVVPGRLQDIATWAPTVERFRPEVVVHLAWCANPKTYLTSLENLDHLSWGIALARFVLSIGCRRLAFAGSCFEYAPTSLPSSEDAPIGPQTLYSAAKAALSLIVRCLAHSAGATVAWARIFHSLGPGENPGRLVPAAIAALTANRDFRATTGDQLRDYLDVRDVAAAMATLAETGADGIFNVSSGRAISVREVLERLARIIGGEGRVHFGSLPMRAGDEATIVGDNRKMLALGWSPRHSLDDSIHDAISWWRPRLIA